MSKISEKLTMLMGSKESVPDYMSEKTENLLNDKDDTTNQLNSREYLTNSTQAHTIKKKFSENYNTNDSIQGLDGLESTYRGSLEKKSRGNTTESSPVLKLSSSQAENVISSFSNRKQNKNLRPSVNKFKKTLKDSIEMKKKLTNMAANENFEHKINSMENTDFTKKSPKQLIRLQAMKPYNDSLRISTSNKDSSDNLQSTTKKFEADDRYNRFKSEQTFTFNGGIDSINSTKLNNIGAESIGSHQEL